MNEAKIRLSAKEMELVCNADWILTKNNILQKAKVLLEEVQAAQQHYLQSNQSMIFEEILLPTPKISKGENYKGLPYLVLDHPRVFNKENVCAIRIMFWWGNFFSVTLLLSGKYKNAFASPIISHYEKTPDEEIFIGINSSEWEHHFENDNYCLLKNMSKNERSGFIEQHHFLKLAKKIPLEKWDDAKQILFAYFKNFIELIAV